MDYETLLEQAELIAQIGSLEMDIHTDKWTISRGLRKIHGLADDAELSAEELLLLAYPEDRPAVEAAFRLALVAGVPVSHEYRIRRQCDGAIRYIHADSKTTYDSIGKPARMLVVTQDITDKKRVEEAKYAVLFDDSPVGISITDDHGNLLECNREAERLLGLSKIEHDQRRYDGPEWRIIRLDGAPMPPEEFASVRALKEHRRVDNVEMGLVKEDGEVTWISVSAAPISLPGYGVAIAYMNITDRVHAQQMLQQSEQRYRLLAENMSDVVWIMDIESGRFSYVSPSVQRLRGFTAEEVMAQPAVEALTPESQLTLAKVMKMRYERFLDAGQSHWGGVELEQPCSDGTTVWTEAVTRYFRNPETGRLEVYGVSRDLTERKKMEDALRVSEERYRMLADESPLAVAVVDAETFAILYVNPRAGALFEIDSNDVVGVPTTRFIADPDGLDRLNAAMVQFGRLNDVELVMRTGTGRDFWVSMNTVMTTYGGRPALHSVYLDISQRKQMEADLHRLNEELEQRVLERTAQLAAAIGELKRADQLKDAFLASVSHELRTPLTGVLGMADALELQIAGQLNERQLNYVRQIHDSGDRLLKMVNSILSYTALLAGRTNLDFELCRLLELGAISIRDTRSAAVAKNIDLRFAIEPLDVEIISVPDGILQILGHLLENAIKFTPENGRVGLDIKREPKDLSVQLTVWDTGIGIAPSQQESIFKPFEQLDNGLARHYEGIGLGLAYVQQMVRLLGGSVAVESELGQGSRFVVTLPLQPG